MGAPGSQHVPQQPQLHVAALARSKPDDYAIYALQPILRQSYVAALRADVIVRRMDTQLASLLRVTTHAEHLRMELQAEHLHVRRPREAHLILAAMNDSLSNIEYVSTQGPCTTRRTAVGRCMDGRLLLIGLKFLGAHLAKSGSDEAWVLTAYYLRENDLRRKLNSGVLRPRDRYA